MSSRTINRQVFTDMSWWHWAITVPMLAAHLAGYSWAIEAAMALCGIVGVYFLVRIKQFRPYPVQVRIAYLGLLAVGMLPMMQWIYWIPLVGTTAMVTVGYCPLIRTLSLAPWNRSEALTPSLMWRAFAVEPCVGGLVQWSSEPPSSSISCCFQPTQNSSLDCSSPNETSTPKEHRHAQVH